MLFIIILTIFTFVKSEFLLSFGHWLGQISSVERNKSGRSDRSSRASPRASPSRTQPSRASLSPSSGRSSLSPLKGYKSPEKALRGASSGSSAGSRSLERSARGREGSNSLRVGIVWIYVISV